MGEPLVLSGAAFEYEHRQRVSDALFVALSGDVNSEVLFDSIAHHLIPEDYPDAAGRSAWLDRTEDQQATLRSTLMRLSMEDGLTTQDAYTGARLLGLVSISNADDITEAFIERI